MQHASFRFGALALVCSLASLPVLASTTNYTYTPLGQVASIDGPRTDVSDITQFAYDAQGNLTTITNALGQVSKRANFDAYGNPQSVTDPNGVVTTMTYTSQGWLATSTTAGATTQYAYNPVGDLAKVTAADGSFLAYTYDDAHRLIAVTNMLGDTQKYTLDAMGNRTSSQVKDASGNLARQQQRTYDELGRLLTQVGAGGQVTRYAYDLNDQLTQQTDARSNATSQAFDALGRIARITDPLGGVTALTYNTDDQITQVVDPRGVITRYTYDAEGRVLQVKSPDGGTSSFSYDEAGNVKQRVDARSVVTTYQYDALDRLIALRYPATPALDVTYTYDQTDSGNKGVGRLTTIKDASGTTVYSYDGFGQRITQNRSLNLAGLDISAPSTYSYDSVGRVVQQGYPDNISVSYARNAAGQVSAVTLSLNGQSFPIASNIAYAPFGPLKQLTWGNGLTLSRTFNQDYQMTAQTVGVWQNQYGFDPVGNISNQQSTLWGAVQYQYDALNRLTREQNAATQKDYAFDATGNRTERKTTDINTGAVIETQTATVAADSNRLETLDGLTLPYDAIGNLRQHTTGLRYAYDDSGRMNAVYQAGSQRVATFTYNSQGQRALKVSFDPVSGALLGGSTYLYGPGGEIIGQADYAANGQRLVTRYWVWMDGMPLAQVELHYANGVSGGFQLVFLHSDHLNTPRLASTHQGIVWSWASDAYGAALPNEDVAGSGKATHIPLRFPGQIYDAQAQLNYNYYRDYDSNLGRYVQSDPIGLKGGLNTYGYASSNPFNRIDKQGLSSTGAINVYVPGSGGSLAAGTGVFAGVGVGAAISNWLSQPMFAKPKPGSKPKGCPSGTIPIDQVPGLDKDALHGVKDGVGAGPRDWTGVAPNGDVYTGDADGNAVNNGPIDDYLP